MHGGVLARDSRLSEIFNLPNILRTLCFRNGQQFAKP